MNGQHDRLQVRVTAAWQLAHRPHLTEEMPAFGVEPFNHPSRIWVWLICPCGAKHLTTEPDVAAAMEAKEEV